MSDCCKQFPLQNLFFREKSVQVETLPRKMANLTTIPSCWNSPQKELRQRTGDLAALWNTWWNTRLLFWYFWSFVQVEQCFVAIKSPIVRKVFSQDALALSIEMLRKIWKPDTYVYNGKKSYLHTITTPNRWILKKKEKMIWRSFLKDLFACFQMAGFSTHRDWR